MKNEAKKEKNKMQKEAHFHRRNLPHIYIEEHTYFITFRLKGSIPQNEINKLHLWKKNLPQAKNYDEKYQQEKIFLLKYDELIHKNKKINYLINPSIAEKVTLIIHKYDGQQYKLICYTIMPNHIHLVFSLLKHSKSIDKIMQNIKRISAYQANRILNKEGNFWQSESFDHIVRDEDELQRVIKYTLYNPVKAGLTDEWNKWEYTYFKYA